MKVAISGASGFIGSALADHLTAGGHRILRLTRKPVSGGSDAIEWDPNEGRIDAPALEGIDAVVHLAGEGIGDHRWTDAHKARVLLSRVRGTTLLAETIARLDSPPKVMLSGSAVGYYGDRGSEELTEKTSPGDDFLADVVQQWEASTDAAEKAGIRVVHLRSGVVQSPRGGALGKQLLPFKLGLGGKLGPGTQWLPWVALEDEVAAIDFLMHNEDASGPFNITSPNPVTNAEFTKALGRALGRPAVFTVPPIALEAIFGSEMTELMLLVSQRVMPRRLDELGYTFTSPELEPALRRMLS